MTPPLFVTLPGAEHLASSISKPLGEQIAEMTIRRFPDGESYVRFLTSPKNRDIIILAALDRPDDKICQLIFACQTALDLGAKSIGLIAPYLPYMRQDKRFNQGEAVTSTYFAKLISANVDWLVTMDPHLHRHASLAKIYACETIVTHAAPSIADWIKANVSKPLIIGPDQESEQWVNAVAQRANAASTVLTKTRRGDHAVEITLPDLTAYAEHTPVIVDDTISTAGTMIEVTRQILVRNMAAPICCAVHGVFAGHSYEALLAAGALKIVTCNTLMHPANEIDITKTLADAVLAHLKETVVT